MIQCNTFNIHTKPFKSMRQRDIFPSVFDAVLFTVAKIQKQPKCPTTCVR